MKVAELIKQLEQYGPEQEVHLSMPSHDYWRTQLAPPVRHVQELQVRHSDYHNSWTVAAEDEDQEETPTVVVLEC